MINKLQTQAENFQLCVDPIYDCFLKDIHCDGIVEEVTNKSISHSLNKKKRRFANLSILTGGNSTVSGFSNISHEDNDFLAQRLHPRCYEILQKYLRYFKEKKKTFDMTIIKHIQKRYTVKK